MDFNAEMNIISDLNIPEAILLSAHGDTKLITPKNFTHFGVEELSDLVEGQITLIPLSNEKFPRRRRRLMCINFDGREKSLSFNSKAFSIFEVSAWGSVVIMNVRDFLE